MVDAGEALSGKLFFFLANDDQTFGFLFPACSKGHRCLMMAVPVLSSGRF